MRTRTMITAVAAAAAVSIAHSASGDFVFDVINYSENTEWNFSEQIEFLNHQFGTSESWHPTDPDMTPLHIASAMGTPAVVLFGPSGEIEWGPWRIPYVLLTSTHPCRPCGHNGCGGGERSECIETIGVHAVASAVERMLRKASAAHG
jgi:hypothetical protein